MASTADNWTAPKRLDEIQAEVDEDTDAVFPRDGWRDRGNRGVFRTALYVARVDLGLSREAARAVFFNAAEAVHRDATGRASHTFWPTEVDGAFICGWTLTGDGSGARCGLPADQHPGYQETDPCPA